MADTDNGIEIIDGGLSTTSSAITHQMDKKSHQVDTSATRAANQQQQQGSGGSTVASNGVVSTTMNYSVDSPQTQTAALAAVGMETTEDVVFLGDDGETKEEEEAAQPFDEGPSAAEEAADADTVPMSHVVPSGHYGADDHADDISSLQHTKYMEPGDKGGSYAQEQSRDDNGMAIIDEEGMEYYDDEAVEHQKALQRRNWLIIIMLVIFLGLVVAIGAGVGLAVKNGPNNPDSANKEVMDDNGGAAGTPDDGQNSGSEGGDLDAITATHVPSSSPSNEGPCIPIEVGILFDQYSDETGWVLVKDNYFPENPEKNEIVWKSKYYNPLDYAKQPYSASDKCFSPGYYTFVFTDKEGDGVCCYHGEGSYVLTSEGKVITIGGEMNSNEESVVFELPFDEPEPEDQDGDGRDDRLGWMMPYDSSSFTEGVDCENFRLVILTDEFGIETTWELYEGQDKAGKLIANGGPYGSEFNYVVDYCLESPKEYVLYVYGELCCETGDGWYRLTSGDIIIRDSDGQFGEVNITQFVLPADGSMKITDEPTPMPSTLEPEVIITLDPTASPVTMAPTRKPSSNPTISPTRTAITWPPALNVGMQDGNRETSPTPPPAKLPTLSPTRPDQLDTGGINWTPVGKGKAITPFPTAPDPMSGAVAEGDKGTGEKEPKKRREERLLI